MPVPRVTDLDRTSGLSVKPMRARERPGQELEALLAGGWLAFIDAGEVAAHHLPAVRDVSQISRSRCCVEPTIWVRHREWKSS